MNDGKNVREVVMGIIKYMPYRLQNIIRRIDKEPDERECILSVCSLGDQVAINAYYRAKESWDSHQEASVQAG